MVRVENRARLFTLLSLHLRRTARTALIHKKTEVRNEVSRRYSFVPKLVAQLPLVVRHHDDLGGAGVELDELAQRPLVSPPGELLAVGPENDVAEDVD